MSSASASRVRIDHNQFRAAGRRRRRSLHPSRRAAATDGSPGATFPVYIIAQAAPLHGDRRQRCVAACSDGVYVSRIVAREFGSERQSRNQLDGGFFLSS
jgi:hypothetical protein